VEPLASSLRQTLVTETRNPTSTPLQAVYQSLLGIASGFSLGWFAWIIADRRIDSIPPFWPFALIGVVLGVILVRLAAATPRGRRLVHLLWIPVVAFVGLMTAIVVALRTWGS
jgi:hypothetical protein